MRRRSIRGARVGALGAVLAFALVLSACGADSGAEDDATSASEDGAELTPVKMAVVPAVTFAPVFVGLEQGIFERHGIDLQIEVGGLAPTIFPQIVNGQLQLGANTWGTLFTAHEQGLPLTGIVPVDRGGSSLDDDYQAVIAKPGGVTSMEELEGKTVAVPTLKSLTDSQVRSVLAQGGVDVDSVEFIAMPFPEMPAALEAGRVDAAGLVEPFLSQVKAAGGEPLASLSQGQPMGAIVASRQWVEEEADTVAKFGAAWQETISYATDNPDDVRTALVSGLELPAEVADAITLPIWLSSVEAEQVQVVADMMIEVGAIEQAVEAGEVMTPIPSSES